MTMADTIAVMNQGRVEQMGAPTELYENPMTTFVANFLGQSNFFDGEISERSGEHAFVSVQGNRVGVPLSRVHSAGDQVHVGVRPEKLRIQFAEGAEVRDGENRLEATISDESFIGVSTQYLVDTAWGQELTVFAQNTGRDARLVPGARVLLTWSPEHTFALDAAQSIDAGVVIDEDAVQPDTVGAPS